MDSSPSFNTHSCINTMDIANRVVQELHNDSEIKDLICFIDEEVNEAEENTQEDEFQFPLVFTDSSLADNIINDQITPRYPLFDRNLLLNLDSNSSNTHDSKPATASTPVLAPTIKTTVTPTSTPSLTPTTVTVSDVTPPTSTIVAASAPTLASITDKVSTSVTPTRTTNTISTSVTSTSISAPTTDTISTFVPPTLTPLPSTDTISTFFPPTLTPLPITDTISTSVPPTLTPLLTTDTISTSIPPTSIPAPTTDTISTIVPVLTSVTAAAPTVTNSDPVSPPPTRLSLGKLFSEDRDSTQSSTLVLESKDFNTISSPQTYCIWKPQEQQEHQLPPKQHHSRGKHKKSNSISISSGDTSPKRWRVRDLLKRSYSDDSKHTSLSSIFYSPSPKEKIGKDGSSVVVFLPPILPKPINEKLKKPEKALKTTASMGGRCTNHNPEDKTPAYKAKVGNIRLPAFLPYRQDQHQVDAFANYTNNGPSKHMYR